jgi:16S rRNA (cytidine1402-2'-O)-methyltransferase
MTVGRLVLVPTPLGNLEDITARALRALRECDVVFAEDTRVTGGLLRHFGIVKPLRSFHERVQAQRLRELTSQLAADKVVAFATDAGMPGISDPAVALVQAARAAGAAVDALPGPSAFVGALVLSGFDVSRFRFDGFPPRKIGARRAYLASLADETAAVVWYEAPTRVLALLDDVARELPKRQVFALREYTKKFEQHARGTAQEVRQQIALPPRGEFTLVLEGSASRARSQRDIPAPVHDALRRLIEGGAGVRAAVDALAATSGVAKNALYKLAQQIKRA